MDALQRKAKSRAQAYAKELMGSSKAEEQSVEAPMSSYEQFRTENAKLLEALRCKHRTPAQREIIQDAWPEGRRKSLVEVEEGEEVIVDDKCEYRVLFGGEPDEARRVRGPCVLMTMKVPQRDVYEDVSIDEALEKANDDTFFAQFLARKFHFFRQFPIAIVKALVPHVTIETKQDRCTIFTERRRSTLKSKVQAEWMYFIARGSVSCAVDDEEQTALVRVFGAGDALIKSDLYPNSDNRPVDLEILEPVVFLVISPEAFRKTIGEVLNTQSVIFPMATCLRILESQQRSEDDVSILLKHASRVGVGSRGVGGTFGYMTRSQRKELCRRLCVKHVSQGDPIFFQGDEAQFYYILLTGSACVDDDDDNCLLPGHSLGERSLILEQPQRESVYAREDCLLLVLDAKAFDDVADDGLVLDVDLSLDLVRLSLEKRKARRAQSLLVNFLQTVPFFSTIGKRTVDLLAPGVCLVSREKNGVVYRQGQECDHLYVIVRGKIALFSHQRNGQNKQSKTLRRRHVRHDDDDDFDSCLDVSPEEYGMPPEAKCVAIVTAGDTFGSQGLLLVGSDQIGRPHTAVAVEPVEILQVSQDSLLEWQRDSSLPAVGEILKSQQSRHVLRHVPSCARTESDVDSVVGMFRDKHLFEQYPIDIMRELARCGCAREVKMGEVLWWQDEEETKSTPHNFILQGEVAVYYEQDEEEEVPSTVDPVVELCKSTRALQELVRKGNSLAEADTLGWRMGFGTHLNTLRKGDSFGGGEGALRGATLVSRETTDLVVLSQKQYDRIFEGRLPPSSHARPSLLESRLSLLKLLEKKSHRRATRRATPEKTTAKLDSLKSSFYQDLLVECVPSANFDSLLPHLDCDAYQPGSVIVEKGSDTGTVYLVVYGVAEVFSRDGTTAGIVRVGGQFGHMPLLWNETHHPVGYRARSLVICMSMNRTTYRTKWNQTYDAEEIKLVEYVRQLPLFRSLSLYDILCVRGKLERLELARGTLKRASEMGDVIYFIVGGQCRLLELKKQTTKKSSRIRVDPRGSVLASTGEHVATLGRYNTFGGSDEEESPAELAMFTETSVVVLCCSLQYLKESYPNLLESIRTSTRLMLDWSYQHVVDSRRKVANPQFRRQNDQVEDGRKLMKKALAVSRSLAQEKSKPSKRRLFPAIQG